MAASKRDLERVGEADRTNGDDDGRGRLGRMGAARVMRVGAAVKTATVHRIRQDVREFERVCDGDLSSASRRDIGCSLCRRLVSVSFAVPLEELEARTRCQADVAFARQIAMYLAHTTLRLLMTEVGLGFGRDRTTVAHACAVVEDRRDDKAFDALMIQLEDLLGQMLEVAEATLTARR